MQAWLLSFLPVTDSPCWALQSRARDTTQRVPEASPFNGFNLFGNAKQKLPRDVGIFGALFFFSMLVFYVFHCCWVSAEMYSAPSIVLQSRTPQGGVHVFDDFREAYGWLRHNTDEEAKVVARMATVRFPPPSPQIPLLFLSLTHPPPLCPTHHTPRVALGLASSSPRSWPHVNSLALLLLFKQHAPLHY